MTQARENTADLRRRFVHPHPEFQARMKISGSEASGAIELAWYRGHQAGLYDAYLKLRGPYPAAANRILKVFGMSKDGALSIAPKKKTKKKAKKGNR